ncbi:MAG: L-lysine 6-transaminase [Acidobacteriota bacterium]
METSYMRTSAEAVRQVISRYMVADGLDLVLDLERSRGVRLFDAKRQEYFLDFFSFYATNPVGLNHPRLTAESTLRELGTVAVQKPSNSDVYSRELADFVETFAREAKPDFMKYLFFIEGGALAVENALKTAFDWKVRKNFKRGIKEEKGYEVIHFRQAFHGRSGYTLSLTNTADPRKTQYFPKFNWPRIINPKCTFPLEGENLRHVEELEQQALQEIRSAIDGREEDVACLIIEPIQGEGGDNHFRPEFHRALRRICDEHEILLIHDEVQTGLGGSGRMWAGEHYVQPDIITFGKKTQVCGIMASGRLDEVPDHVFRIPSRVNSTWGGNLVDMVRCRHYLEIYREEKLLDNAKQMGRVLLCELQKLHEEFPDRVMNPRGLGLLCAFDLPTTEFRNEFRKKLFAERLVLLGCGERSVRFRTALNINEEEMMEGIQIIRQVLGAMA